MAAGNPQNTSPSNGGKSKSPSSQSKKDQGKTGKAGSSKKMTDKEQYERFIETARELGVDESGLQFEEALRKIGLKE